MTTPLVDDKSESGSQINFHEMCHEEDEAQMHKEPLRSEVSYD